MLRRGHISANLGETGRTHAKDTKGISHAGMGACSSYSTEHPDKNIYSPNIADNRGNGDTAHEIQRGPSSSSQAPHPHHATEGTQDIDDPHLAIPPMMGPFNGDYGGIHWNSQAYFATDPGRQTSKQGYADSLVDKRDFIGLSETHSTPGNITTANLPTSNHSGRMAPRRRQGSRSTSKKPFSRSSILTRTKTG